MSCDYAPAILKWESKPSELLDRPLLTTLNYRETFIILYSIL